MRTLALLLCLVGCGNVRSDPPDGGDDDVDSGGGDIDSGTTDDAPSTDAPTSGVATVQVQLAGVATGGLKVNFQEADGSLISEADTDTSGTATGTIHANAMVTIAVGPRALVTITGVNPGETITLRTPPPFDNSSAGTVTFSAATEAPSKSFYRVDLGNDVYSTFVTMTSGTRSLSLSRGNLDGNGRFNLYAGTYDTGNRLISYTFSNNIVPNASGTTAVSLPNNWRTDLNEFVLSVNGAPTAATQLRGTTWSETANLQFAPNDFGTSITPLSAAINGGNASVNQRYPGSFGDFVQTVADVTFGTTRESASFWRRVARPAGAFTIAANNFPARIGTPALDKTVPTRPVASWTVTGSTVNGDATIIDLGWRDASNLAYEWLVYAPPATTSFAIPAVSSSLTAQAPGQSTYNMLRVTQANLDPVGGYASFHLAPVRADGDTYPIPVGFTAWAYDSNYTTTP
ncbi:MAG TPA: hypothetical protein VM261_26300 [Kofleriaceae bacterium]|nr:hypothetical protein [Kofleriaceae bacterium]